MDILSDEEKELWHSPSVFIAKRSLEKKLIHLLEDISRLLEKENYDSSGTIPTEVMEVAPKVSRGENYLQFPWIVLDYPRFFTKSDVFALRTFCWFTQGISITLHLSGKYLKHLTPAILSHKQYFLEHRFSIGINNDPWVHHFGEDNYTRPKTIEELENLIEASEKRGVLKLMQQHSLNELGNLPQHVLQYFKLVQTISKASASKQL